MTSLLMVLVSSTFANCFSQMQEANVFQALHWRLVGPFRGGRVEAVAGIAGDPRTYYFGAVGGGVWKTADGGSTWKPVFDGEATQAIGAIGIAPADPDVIYVGTGEPSLRNDITFGNGVYRSTDGGGTWQHVGLEDTRHISKVIVDPRDPDIVFVAAVGHASGPNAQRGVFKSTDGGRTWKRVLFRDDKTGAIDLCMDPANPHVLFAALYQIYRAPWTLEAGGPGSGLYKSVDGGETWTHIEGHGLPDGPLGRIAIAVAAHARRIYALVEAKNRGGMYRSDDGGATWQLTDGEHAISQRPWYFSQIFVDPQNPDRVYSLAYRLLRSIDGGHRFTTIAGSHADHHALWIDPTDPRHMIEGNDGGATITLDGGGSWTPESNQPTGQFYHVIADDRFMYRIYGSQQDNTSVSIASRTDHGQIDDTDWYQVAGGESGYIAPDPANQDVVYAGGYAGTLTRLSLETGETQMISAWPQFMDGLSAAEVKHRFNWTSPLIISPRPPHALYHGAEVIFKSVNQGMSWTAISPDLTRNDKSKQQSSGGPVSADNAGTEYYDTVFTIAESKLSTGLIWAGSDDGLIHLTRDGGAHWSDVTPPDMPAWSRVDLIEASPHEPGVAWAAVDRHLLDDMRPYIYRTEDFGKTWVMTTEGIAETDYVHAVREDPERRGLLFAGTEHGVYVSLNNGANWQPLQGKLPHAPVYDLIVKRDDLVAATHGRGFWILDDIAALRQVSRQTVAEDVHLFAPSIAFRLHSGGRPSTGGAEAGKVTGANPPQGAIIDYYLRVRPSSPITLVVLDSGGHVLRRFRSEAAATEAHEDARPEAEAPAENSMVLPAAQGLNRFVWDLHLDPPKGVPYAVYQEGSHLQGVLVMPGHYTLRLEVAGKPFTVPLEVRLDPRVQVNQEDLRKQFDFASQIAAGISQAHTIVNEARDLDSQIGRLEARAADSPQLKQANTAAGAIDQKALAIEDSLFQVKKEAEKDSFNYGGRLNDMLIGLLAAVERSDSAPTEQMYDVFRGYSAQLQEAVRRWNEVKQQDVPALNRIIARDQIPFLEVSPTTPRDPAN